MRSMPRACSRTCPLYAGLGRVKGAAAQRAAHPSGAKRWRREQGARPGVRVQFSGSRWPSTREVRPSSGSGAPGAGPWGRDRAEAADAVRAGFRVAVPSAPRPTCNRSERMSGCLDGWASDEPDQDAAAASCATVVPPGKHDPSRERAAACGRRAADRDGPVAPRRCAHAAFSQPVR
jgi:hypothetical protein